MGIFKLGTLVICLMAAAVGENHWALLVSGCKWFRELQASGNLSERIKSNNTCLP